jgi:hypothetical protein
LREERILRLFGNRLLRRIFGPKRDGATREWKKLHNEELNDLYSHNIFRLITWRRMREAGHIACTGREEIYPELRLGNLRGKRNFGRPSHKWEDNIKTDLQELGYGGVDWIDLAQNKDRWRALVNTVMKLRVS